MCARRSRHSSSRRDFRIQRMFLKKRYSQRNVSHCDVRRLSPRANAMGALRKKTPAAKEQRASSEGRLPQPSIPIREQPYACTGRRRPFVIPLLPLPFDDGAASVATDGVATSRWDGVLSASGIVNSIGSLATPCEFPFTACTMIRTRCPGITPGIIPIGPVLSILRKTDWKTPPRFLRENASGGKISTVSCANTPPGEKFHFITVGASRGRRIGLAEVRATARKCSPPGTGEEFTLATGQFSSDSAGMEQEIR